MQSANVDRPVQTTSTRCKASDTSQIKYASTTSTQTAVKWTPLIITWTKPRLHFALCIPNFLSTPSTTQSYNGVQNPISIKCLAADILIRQTPSLNGLHGGRPTTQTCTSQTLGPLKDVGHAAASSSKSTGRLEPKAKSTQIYDS